MLGKLIKYEFKSTGRLFLPMYIALLLVAAVNRIFRVGKANFAFAISLVLLVGLFIALGVITLMMIIQRFNRNLLGDEGYLMFTLPVNVSELVFSKLIVSFIWNILSTIVSFICGMILLGDKGFFVTVFTKFGEIWNKMTMMCQNEFKMDSVLFIILSVILCILCYAAFIFQIYLSLSAAQLPVFCKHRGIVAFTAFFVINVVLTICSSIIGQIIPDSITETYLSDVIFLIIMMFIQSALLFFGIKYTLENHLNLE